MKPKPTPVAAFVGKQVALTGTLTTMKRAAAQALLQEAGAIVASGVTKTTDILVYGENAGSKLDKAERMGITLMTEAEMVALLTAGGAGGEQLAGASEQLAEEQAGPRSEIAAAVAELRVFVRALEQRKDITVERAELGRKASKPKLAQLRAAGIPEELVELYAEVDGIHVQWRFVEPPGEGNLRIPPVSQWTRFGGEDQHYMGFGDDCEALLLDEITAEGNTWLVRTRVGSGRPKPASIIFASAAEGAEGISPAKSIAEYLRQAMASGFAPYWPRCFRPSRHVSYATQEAIVERFKAAPVAPGDLGVGSRVHFQLFSEGGRGHVLATHSAPASSHTQWCGTEFAEVQLDEGSRAWLPRRTMKVHGKKDAYERLRAPDFDFGKAVGEDLGGMVDELTRAIGPLSSYTMYEELGKTPSNSRLAAGLLSSRPLADAVGVVLALDAAITKAKLDRDKSRKLGKTGEETDGPELARHRWEYRIGGLLEGLYGGLNLLVHHASRRDGIAGNAVLDKKLVARIPKGEATEGLLQGCKRRSVLEVPSWGQSDEETGPRYGLAAGARVWTSTGS